MLTIINEYGILKAIFKMCLFFIINLFAPNKALLPLRHNGLMLVKENVETQT